EPAEIDPADDACDYAYDSGDFEVIKEYAAGELDLVAGVEYAATDGYDDGCHRVKHVDFCEAFTPAFLHSLKGDGDRVNDGGDVEHGHAAEFEDAADVTGIDVCGGEDEGKTESEENHNGH